MTVSSWDLSSVDRHDSRMIPGDKVCPPVLPRNKTCPVAVISQLVAVMFLT